MKTQSKNRGLYRQVTKTPESEQETVRQLDELSSATTDYIEQAKRIASDTLRAAGIDPDAPLEVVSESPGRFVRHSRIDQDELDPEAYYALKILECCEHIRNTGENVSSRDAMHYGILLAQAVGQLNANRSWLKPVLARKNSDRNLQNKPRKTDDEIMAVVNDPQYPLRKQQAAALGYKTSRQLQARLKKIK